MSQYYVLEVVLLLISAITKVEMKCSNNLLMCLEMSCAELTDEHIENNLDKINNLDDNGKAALHYAVTSGKLRCVKKLLKYGADPNIETSDGETPLHMVCGEYWVCKGCVLSLLEAGANQSLTNINGETPIFNFYLYKCPRCMDTLIKWGGDVDARNFDGDTPLCRLVVDEDDEAVRDVFMPYLKKLMMLCADPFIRCMEGMTATEIAEDYEQKHNIKVLREYAKQTQCSRNETKAGKECICEKGQLRWLISKDNKNNRNEDKNKNDKMGNKEEELVFNESVHRDEVHPSGAGCTVNGTYLIDGTNWLEDCWLYQCKDGRIIHTLNPSSCLHKDIIYSNNDDWKDNCTLYNCRNGIIHEEQDLNCTLA